MTAMTRHPTWCWVPSTRCYIRKSLQDPTMTHHMPPHDNAGTDVIHCSADYPVQMLTDDDLVLST